MKSSRKPELSAQAEIDLRAILQYSVTTWGARQRDAYSKAITAVLRKLAAFPEMGRPQDHLLPGLRSHPVKQHVIYYQVEERTVYVVRILHAKMDASSHLEGSR